MLIKYVPRPEGNTVVVGCGDAAFTRHFSRQAHVRRFSSTAALVAAGVRVLDGVYPRAAAQHDAVILPLENGRVLARTMILRSLLSLRPGGNLWVAGSVRAGVRTFEDDAAELGTVDSVYAGSGCRIFKLTRAEAQPVAQPIAQPIAPIHWAVGMTPVPFDLRNRSYVQYTQPGVFSADHLDEGTKFLLDALPAVPAFPSARVLDACCGAGAIGLVVRAEWPAADVTFADDDLLAVECCRASAGEHARVVPADLTLRQRNLAGVRDFDLIVCNPPFHQGLTEDRSFVPRFVPVAAGLVSPKRGQLLMVANRFLPYQRDLSAAFANVQVVAEDRKWRVWLASETKA